MAWHGSYYYRSVRVGRRVVTEYMGSGPAGLLAAEHDALVRQERQRTLKEREAQREVDRAIDAAGGWVRTLTRAVLLVSGYHTHKGTWRRRRHG